MCAFYFACMVAFQELPYSDFTITSVYTNFDIIDKIESAGKVDPVCAHEHKLPQTVDACAAHM